MNTLQFIITLISSSAFSACLMYIMAREKTKAEVKELEIGNVQSVVDLWKQMVESLRIEVSTLTTEVTGLRKENIQLRLDINHLEKTIKLTQKQS